MTRVKGACPADGHAADTAPARDDSSQSPLAPRPRNWGDLAAAVLCLAFVIFTLASIAFTARAHAAEAPVIERGTGVLTTFSGTTRPSKGSPGTTLDQTLIDPSGTSLEVLDLSSLGGAPKGQIAAAAAKLKVSAEEIGQVFGVALAEREPGAAPDIYAAATSLFGLQIVTDGKGDEVLRLVDGAPGARWAPGQFGLGKGGGPGAVWKIDGTTGAVSLFATLKSGTTENAGPGLGGIAFDPVSRQLFVANLETGLIHRLDLEGRDLGVFDHGRTARALLGLPQAIDDPDARMDIHDAHFNIEDPATWGYAHEKRRVMAVTVHDGRLYYSVAEGPAVWSIGLIADGSFADDARRELDVTGTPDNNPITALAFDGTGRLYLTQRGRSVGSYDYATFARPGTSVVYRYTWDASAKVWTEAPEEYAVGMRDPHRATNGGLALAYGYDSAGRMETGRCSETVWTTGEHLNGEDSTRDDASVQGTPTTSAVPATVSRARSGSEALQGFNIIESDLTAPDESWFVEDGAARESNTHGQAGQIAVHAPCDAPAAAPTVVARAPVPETPLPPQPGVSISKVCKPGPLGGVIPCTITVTNIGWTPVGTVGFTDASQILAGPDKGAAVLITSAAPDGADWICSPTPTATFGCTLPATALPPGASRSVDVTVDTGPLVAAGNSGFRNCASLALPWSGTACVESQTQITVKKTAPASCLPGAACKFGLTITNGGAQGFSGDVLISDSLFIDGGGAPIAAPITAIAPSLGCAPDPAALPFSCVAPMTLVAGQSKTFEITVTMPAAPANYWAQNCFSASAPGQPAPALPPGPGASAAVSCAWVPVGVPLPLANLAMSKSPVTCFKQGPDTVRCTYEIGILNNGPSPSTDFITFTETVPASSTLASIGATFACAGGPPVYACTTPAAPTINPGDLLTIPVAIDLDRAPLEAAKCWAPNAVAITAPVGAPKNFNGADDTAVATADAAWIRFDEGGPLELVLCDPTNLKTTKVPDGPCDENGDNYRCGYTVTITNTGPDPFKGQIDVTDTFSVTPTDVKFPPEWDCGGAGANWTCSHTPLELLKGKSVSLAITAKFPKESRCVVSNTATMIFPPANTRWNGNAADDSATAFSPIPSPECKRTPKCEAPAEGEMRTASGACACAEGFARDRNNRCVKVDPEEPPQLVEPEPEPPVVGEPPITTPVCIPGPNEMTTASGRCVCRPGFVRYEGRCVYEQEPPVHVPVCIPGPNEVIDQWDRCVCRPGFTRNRFGICVPLFYVCIPGPHEHRTAFNRCVCDKGYERNRHGRCVPTEPDRCPPGMEGKPPYCKPKVCDEGTTGKWPNCKPITCPPGTTGRPPHCKPKECDEGYTGTWPNCKPIEKPHCPPGTTGTPPRCKPDVCPTGMTGTPPNCKPMDKPKCPEGTVGRPPACVPVPIKCPEGTFGKPPNCKPKVCDEGYTGKWPNCRPIEKPRCPTGTPPNCKPLEKPKCPPGTTGIPPNCKAVETPKCPPGTFGKPPKCKPIEKPRCPPGTTGVPPNCKPVEKPKCPKGTTGTPPNCKAVEKPKCPPGTVGKPPACIKFPVGCPKGQVKDSKGNCVARKVESKPADTKPKFDPKLANKTRVQLQKQKGPQAR